MDRTQFKSLQSASHAAAADIARSVSKDDERRFHDQLLAHVETGALPSSVAAVWLGMRRNPELTVDGVRQDFSLSLKRAAVETFCRHLCRIFEFAAAWEAVGRERGLVDVMATLSVDALRYLCGALGRVAKSARGTGGDEEAAEDVVEERQLALTDLYRLLVDPAANPDKRPLQDAYEAILPACHADFIKERITSQNNSKQRRRLFNLYPKLYMESVLPRFFDPSWKPGWDEKLEVEMRFGHEPRLFMLARILETDDSDSVRWAESAFVPAIATPLLRTCLQRRTSTKGACKILRPLAACIEKHPRLMSGIGRPGRRWSPGGDFFTSAVALISSRPRTRKLVGKFLEQVLPKVPKSVDIQAFHVEEALRNARPQIRYALHRILLSKLPQFEIDIQFATESQISSLRTSSHKEQWSADLFTLLPPAAAASTALTFQRVFQGPFMPSRRKSTRITILRRPTSDSRGSWRSSHDLDLKVAYAYSCSQCTRAMQQKMFGGWKMEALSELSERRSSAERARTPEERAAAAVSALFMAVATGEVEYCAETLVWMRRFLPDARALPAIYSRSNFFSHELLALLAGVPDKRRLSDLDVRNSIPGDMRAADAAMADMLETIKQAAKLPGFRLSSWTILIETIFKVVEMRLQKAAAVRAQHTLGDILQPSIGLVILVEDLLHEMKPEPSFDYPDRVSSLIKEWEIDLSDPDVATFIDEMAKARDENWRAARIRHDPNVSTLQFPWPQGLPVQLLFPFKSIPEDGLRLPFIQQRAESIVFGDVKQLLSAAPEDMEVFKKDIWPFVDDYIAALAIFINGPEGRTERQDRKDQVHQYVLKHLIGPRMSDREGASFWRLHFDLDRIQPSGVRQQSPGHDRLNSPYLEGIRSIRGLPEVDDESAELGPTEWNPGPTAETGETTTRTFELLVIDLLVGRYGYSHPRFPPKPCAYLHPPASFFDHGDMGKGAEGSIPPSALDAYTVALVLFIDTAIGTGSNVLKTALPSLEHCRYPAVYLDDDFLEKHSDQLADSKIGSVISELRQYSQRVHPSLLQRLAASVLRKLESPETKTTPHGMSNAIQLVSTTAGCDRPAAACDLIKQIVLDRPQDSSWHRVLLTRGFLRSLSASEVREFFTDLASAIEERLFSSKPGKTAQEREPEGSASGDDSSTGLDEVVVGCQPDARPTPTIGANPSSTPLVKITTVKMIAQLLRDADYLDEKTSCEILTSLLGARHIDIKAVAMKSTLDFLRKSKREEVRDIALRALESRIVGVAGALDERQPLCDKDWEDAEGDGRALPTVGSETPILSSIQEGLDLRSPSEIDCVVATRLLVPALEKSAESNRRWVGLLSRRCGLSVSEAELGGFRVPCQIDTLEELVRRTPWAIPSAVFEMFERLIWIRLFPPPIVKQVVGSTSLAADAAAKEHWIRITGYETADTLDDIWSRVKDGSSRDEFDLLASAVSSFDQKNEDDEAAEPRSPGVPGAVGLERYEELVGNIGSELLLQNEVRSFESLFSAFVLRESEGIGHGGCRNVICSLFQKAAEARASAMGDKQRQDSCLLPDLFDLEVKMKIASVNRLIQLGEIEKPEELAQEACGAVSELIRKISTQEVYHAYFAAIKKSLIDACEKATGVETGVLIAASIGRIEELGHQPTALELHLRVELAGSLLESSLCDMKRMWELSSEMIASWSRSRHENIRLRGQLIRRLFTRALDVQG